MTVKVAVMRLRRIRLKENGFTTLELLIYLIIATLVVTGVYQLLIGQSRLYSKQRELQDLRSSLRAAATLLAWDLRQASPSGGDLYSISDDSFTVRSIQGAGIICGEHTGRNKLRYGLWGTSGEFYSTSDDSALVFVIGDEGTGDDGWTVLSIAKEWTPDGGGVPFCFWGDTIAGKGKGRGNAKGQSTGKGKSAGGADPETVLELNGNVDDIYIGAPLRAFRRIQYGIYQQEGRWWLGRIVGSSGSWERLTGPLRAPADSGLKFIYYDANGNTTSTPADVRMVDIIVRGESLGRAPRGGGQAAAVVQDTLTYRVHLRG